MHRAVIRGGIRLHGRVAAQRSRTSTLALIAAAVLREGPVVIEETPGCKDVYAQASIAADLGARVVTMGRSLYISSRAGLTGTVPHEVSRRIVPSLLFIPVLLGRMGRIRTAFPSGRRLDSNGLTRAIIQLMSAMGADIKVEGGEITAIAGDGLHAVDYMLDKPDVLVTLAGILAGCQLEEKTVLLNAAQDPEIVDVANLLRKMGARIFGAGTSEVRVCGPLTRPEVFHRPIPDRLDVGTLLLCGAVTGGEVCVTGCIPEHMKPLLCKIEQAGGIVSASADTLMVEVDPPTLKPVEVTTGAYPGVAGEYGSLLAVLLSFAGGDSVIVGDTGTWTYLAEELRRLGADIDVEGRIAVVKGGASWNGARVRVSDGVTGAALVGAGLVGSGSTVIEDVEKLDAVYTDLLPRLNQLGAKIVCSNHQTHVSEWEDFGDHTQPGDSLRENFS